MAASIIPRVVLFALVALAIIPELGNVSILALGGTWEEWEKATGTLENIVTIVALFIGGVWTYYTFIKGRAATPHLELKVSGRVFLDGSAKFLIVNFQIKNIGTTKVDIIQKGTGALVYTYLPTKPEGPNVKWGNLFEGQGKFTILGDHYWIEPGELVEDPLLVALPTGKHTAYKILVRVNSYNTTWTTAAIIDSKPEEGG